MHALITGIGGFVGGRVARAFLDADWRVTGICRKRGPSRLSPHPALSVVTADLRNCRELPDRYDYLVHCAADIPAYCSNDDELYRSNVEGTQRLLTLATAVGVNRIAYLSSMAVYGKISSSVVNENTSPNTPDIYGQSKAEGERLVAEWSRCNEGAAVSVRLPGVIGAGGRNNFLCDMLQRIITDQTVNARNPDALFNNVVHVDKLATFIVTLDTNMPKGHTVLTVAAREPLAIRDVLARLYQRTGRKERITWEGSSDTPFLITFDRACTLGYRPATVADSIDLFVTETLAERPQS